MLENESEAVNRDRKQGCGDWDGIDYSQSSHCHVQRVFL